MRNKLYETMLGVAIGDALGVPAEFTGRNTLKKRPITDMVGGGVWNQPPGTWSDDTAMMLATFQALRDNKFNIGKKTLEDIMNNFLLWYKDGKFACCGYRFDIGNTCREAIYQYDIHRDVFSCGCTGEDRSGNGALMRIAPAMIYSENAIEKLTQLTHNTKPCIEVSKTYIKFLELLMDNDKETSFKLLVDYIKFTKKEYIPRLYNKEFCRLDENLIKSGGYAVHTLEAAIWCFMNTDTYSECVLKAVNLGDDTDTTAAVAGGIAGLYYGINEINGIPQKWINQLRDKETFDKICKL